MKSRFHKFQTFTREQKQSCPRKIPCTLISEARSRLAVSIEGDIFCPVWKIKFIEIPRTQSGIQVLASALFLLRTPMHILYLVCSDVAPLYLVWNACLASCIVCWIAGNLFLVLMKVVEAGRLGFKSCCKKTCYFERWRLPLLHHYGHFLCDEIVLVDPSVTSTMCVNGKLGHILVHFSYGQTSKLLFHSFSFFHFQNHSTNNVAWDLCSQEFWKFYSFAKIVKESNSD